MGWHFAGHYCARSCNYVLLPGYSTLSHSPLRHAQLRHVGLCRPATINLAEQQYKSAYPQRGYSRTLGELGPGSREWCSAPPNESAACLINPYLANATSAASAKTGYFYTYVPGPPNAQGMIESYSVHRDPANPHTGIYHYYGDETGVIRVERDRPAGKDSPVI